MSKFKKTIKSKFYWIAKGQGEIYKMLEEQVKERGDAAKLAKTIGKSPGYVSQILNGDSELNPTWKKIVEFCLALNKVPVLELKDSSEYIAEQKLKASYTNYGHLYLGRCDHDDLFTSPKEIATSEFFELSEFFDLDLGKNSPSNKTELIFDESFTEFEYI